MLAAPYEVITQNIHGDDRWTHQSVRSNSPAHNELNKPGSWTFSVPLIDEGLDKLEPLVREVQLWREDEDGQNQLMFWGVITNRDRTENGYDITAAGLLWYFTRRYFGKAGRNNWLSNASFDESTVGLPHWTAIGVTANVVKEWTYKPDTAFSANLYQAGSGTDTFLQQIVTVPGGNLWTLSAWFHIRADSTWVGPALDGRGLYIERRHPTTDAVEDIQFFAITDETPRGVFQRAMVTMYSPPGRNSKFIVRLYATRCTNATPVPPRPPGSIIWDNVQLVLMESVSFPHADMAQVLNAIVAHAQDPSFGKSDLHITPDCHDTGIYVDRTYQHADHRQVSDALDEFPTSGLCDIEVKWADDGSSRSFVCYYPQQGIDRDIVLELGAVDRVRRITRVEEWSCPAVTDRVGVVVVRLPA